MSDKQKNLWLARNNRTEQIIGQKSKDNSCGLMQRLTNKKT